MFITGLLLRTRLNDQGLMYWRVYDKTLFINTGPDKVVMLLLTVEFQKN